MNTIELYEIRDKDDKRQAGLYDDLNEASSVAGDFARNTNEKYTVVALTFEHTETELVQTINQEAT